MSSRWTPDEIRTLGPTTDLPTLGRILGVSRWKVYKMAQAGEWEQVGIRIVPIGTRYRVAVQSILEVLGYRDPADSGPGDPQIAGNAQDDAVVEPSRPVAARGRP